MSITQSELDEILNRLFPSDGSGIRELVLASDGTWRCWYGPLGVYPGITSGTAVEAIRQAMTMLVADRLAGSGS